MKKDTPIKELLTLDESAYWFRETYKLENYYILATEAEALSLDELSALLPETFTKNKNKLFLNYLQMAEKKAPVPLLSPWPGILSPKERFKSILDLKPFDRMFHWERGFTWENTMEWPVFRENRASLDEATQLFGFDPYYLIQTRAWLSPPYSFEKTGETETEFLLQNKNGLLARVPREGSVCFPYFSYPQVIDEETWNKVKKERLNPQDPTRSFLEGLIPDPDSVREKPLILSLDSLTGNLKKLLTSKGVVYQLHGNLALFEEMLDTVTEIILGNISRILPRVEPDMALLSENLYYHEMNRQDYRKFIKAVVPRFRRISRALKKGGIPHFGLVCPGEVLPMSETLTEAGFDTLIPSDYLSAEDFLRYVKNHRRRFRIIGGIDSFTLLTGGDSLKRHMEALKELSEEGGLIPCLNEPCPPLCSEKNYLHYLALKKEYFG